VQHPFVHRQASTSDGAALFCSPADGDLYGLVAGDAVEHSAIFPDAAWPAVARAAACASTSRPHGMVLGSVSFWRPSASGLVCEATLFQVQLQAEDGTTKTYTFNIFAWGGISHLLPSPLNLNINAPSSPGGSGKSGTLWLMLVLLAMALVLCGLSVLVSMQMYWIRVALHLRQRGATSSRAPTAPLTAE